MAKVKLLSSRVCQIGEHLVSQAPGDKIEVGADEAQRMIEGGLAEDADAVYVPKKETPAKKEKPAKKSKPADVPQETALAEPVAPQKVASDAKAEAAAPPAKSAKKKPTPKKK